MAAGFDLTQPHIASDFGYRARAFPLPDTNRSPNYGEIKPGVTTVGTSSETSTKQRLAEIFTSVASSVGEYYGNVIAKKKAQVQNETEILNARRLAIQRANSPYDAGYASQFLGSDNTKIILAIGIGVVLLLMLRK